MASQSSALVACAVDREIGPPFRCAAGVRVGLQPLKHGGRRKVPKVSLVKVLSAGGVFHPTGFIRSPKRQPRALPFAKQPLLEREPIDPGLESILHAHFRRHGKATNPLRIDVARDVGHRLVPDVAVLVPPPMLLEQRMNRGPSDFRVPEPERCERRGPFGPGSDVGLVPVGQAKMIGRVAFEAQDAIASIGNDDRGLIPTGIAVQGVGELQRDSVVGPAARSGRASSRTERPRADGARCALSASRRLPPWPFASFRGASPSLDRSGQRIRSNVANNIPHDPIVCKQPRKEEGEGPPGRGLARGQF